jgi:ureidoacrylate peracid hydrolase
MTKQPTAWGTQTALLAIGLQNDHVEPKGTVLTRYPSAPRISAALPEIAALLLAARRADVLVIHAPELSLPNGLSDSPAWASLRTRNSGAGARCVTGTWGSEPADSFGPRPGELVSPRHRSSALLDSRTSVLLRSNGVRTIVICGTETHDAVLATAATAACLDFNVVIAADCVASAEWALHDAALAILPTWADIRDRATIEASWPVPERID